MITDSAITELKNLLNILYNIHEILAHKNSDAIVVYINPEMYNPISFTDLLQIKNVINFQDVNIKYIEKTGKLELILFI
jgi:hypothetical protein